ncbi:hypothetical protein GCM10010372_32090 [Streptomyces tauricus]|nr:hypothetical protein GCM10010372_32090 [Streptomyces tauricus]
MKYAAGGIGVPRSRRSTFSSRSIAMEMPSDWKLVVMMPAAIIAGTYSCEAVTPAPVTSSLKIDAKRKRNTMGKAKVKTTWSRSRKNCLISRAPRWKPSRQAAGSRCVPLSRVGTRAVVVVIARPPAP